MRSETVRRAVSLFGIALAASIVFSTAAFFVAQSNGLDLVRLTGDSKNYQLLAENILTHGVFSSSQSEPHAPESFRAPGYPLFLAANYFLTADWFLVLIIQIVVVSVAPALLYLLFAPYHERAAWWGAFLFALEPTRLFLSASLLSDALFACTLLGALLALERGKRTDSLTLTGVSGALLGVSILVRPIAIFLPIATALYLALAVRPLSRACAMAVLGVACAAVVVFPWSVRNHQLFGSWNVSSVGSANLMLYNAPVFAAYLGDPAVAEKVAQFKNEQASLPREEALSLARSGVFTDTFRETVRGHELSYLGFHLSKTVPFFVTDGLREIARLIGLPSAPAFNITDALFGGKMGDLLAYLRVGGFSTILLVVGSGFWVTVTVLFFLEMFSGIARWREFSFTLFLSVVVLYFALLTGPVSNARYRLPVEGILLASALMFLIKKTDRA